MARDDRWRAERHFDFNDEARRMASRPDYGQTDYGYGDYRADERARRDEEERRRWEEENRRHREHAFRPFGDTGPTAYGIGPGFVDPATGFAPFAPYSFPYGSLYGDFRAPAYGARGPAGPARRYVPNPREGRGEEPRSFMDKATDEVASWFGDRDAERRRHWDEAREDMRADHRGRGPRGYRRSDERIREDVSDRLTDDPYLDATEIEVAVAEGEVTLTGVVATREDKRRAERLAEDCTGVSDVQNNVKVRRAGPEAAAGTTGPTGGY
jgi:hypothetical protein